MTRSHFISFSVSSSLHLLVSFFSLSCETIQTTIHHISRTVTLLLRSFFFLLNSPRDDRNSRTSFPLLPRCLPVSSSWSLPILCILVLCISFFLLFLFLIASFVFSVFPFSFLDLFLCFALHVFSQFLVNA